MIKIIKIIRRVVKKKEKRERKRKRKKKKEKEREKENLTCHKRRYEK